MKAQTQTQTATPDQESLRVAAMQSELEGLLFALSPFIDRLELLYKGDPHFSPALWREHIKRAEKALMDYATGAHVTTTEAAATE